MQEKKSWRRWLFIGLPALLVALYYFGPGLQEWVLNVTSGDAPHFARGTLTLERADGQTFPLQVEIARTPKEMTYGLMFRRSLPHDAGMIFLQDPDRVAIFWMENTFIPLDMVFIKRDGTIAQIVKNAKPLDLTPIPSETLVHGILEINGGDSDKMNLRVGDKVHFPGFGG